jgi:predicted AlkP superfamily pyrophosphatase or phosphodiesterase
MVDIAPTLAALLGIGLPAGDGAALDQVLDGCLPERVLVLLLDGSNANVLTAMAEAGELPSIASLMARGTTFGHGLVASFPSVTMANHTTALTGLHPGHHGLLHNAFYDRSSGRSVVTNSPEVWHLAREEMRPGIETIFEALARAGAGPTAAVNEPCDRGATYATFDALRSGAVRTVGDALPDASDVPGATRAFAEGDLRYGWSSAADHLAVQQAVDLLNGAAGARAPRLLWVNLILTDTAGHIGGPYGDMAHASLRDTDARVAQILRAAGDDEATAVVLLADHGMEESDPHCTGDWKPALRAAGIPVRDEGEGFLYLGA